MKYFVVSIQKVGETAPTSIFAYNSEKEAYSAYHATLASNYISDVLDGFSVAILNEHGGTEIKEYWEETINPEETVNNADEPAEVEENEETEAEN